MLIVGTINPVIQRKQLQLYNISLPCCEDETMNIKHTMYGAGVCLSVTIRKKGMS